MVYESEKDVRYAVHIIPKMGDNKGEILYKN